MTKNNTKREERNKKLAEKNKAFTEQTKQQQLALGITHYTWSSVCDERTCETCKKNNNKTFAWNDPPPCGHAGAATCCTEGYCRCIPLPYLDHLISDGGVKPQSRTRKQDK